jgi:hypothetical protein
LVLQAGEHAIVAGRMRQSRTQARGRLKPLLAVMIGDLSVYAGRYGVWLPLLWRALLDGKNSDSTWCPDPGIRNVVSGRINAMLYRGGPRGSSPSEIKEFGSERAAIEYAYRLILSGQQLDPRQWLSFFNRKAGQGSGIVDPIPWIPILRTIARPLFQAGYRAEAYQALVASSPPSSKTAMFDVLSKGVNEKSSVVFFQKARSTSTRRAGAVR